MVKSFHRITLRGGPAQDWMLSVEDVALRDMLAGVTGVARWVQGADFAEFELDPPPGAAWPPISGTARFKGRSRIEIENFSFEMAWHLIEAILQAHPENTQIVVGVDGKRAFCYQPGLPADAALRQFSEDHDASLSASVFRAA